MAAQDVVSWNKFGGGGMKNKLLFTGYEWNPDLIEKLWEVIDKIGREELELDYFQPQFDIVTAEQMIDAYSSVGMPIYYNHWSFGKDFIKNQNDYKNGKMNLAYEMVINSNPCLAYLMEDNTAVTTALVIAHANCGHAHFFKNNYLFKQHSDPDNILNDLKYAKNFIMDCEQKHGPDSVELLLNLLHVIAPFGINKYNKRKISAQEKEKREILKKEISEQLYNKELDCTPDIPNTVEDDFKRFLKDIDSQSQSNRDEIFLGEENLLQFIIDHTLVLEDWQIEIVKIIANIQQYFYPQSQTKVMNEGWACFVHYHIMHNLYEQGYIDEGAYLEFIQLHTSVCAQWDMSALNPYALGFEIFMDLKRACLNPDEEDYLYLSSIAGKSEWKKELKNIVKYFKDESFVLQFLSPKVIRKFKLFSYHDNAVDDYVKITATQNDESVKTIRRLLSESLSIDNWKPDLEVETLDKIDSAVTIRYRSYKERDITDIEKVGDILRELTGYRNFYYEEE